MRRWSRLPRTLLLCIAIVFTAVVVLYSCVWMYCARWHPNARLGIEQGSPAQPYSALISKVEPGSAAAEAGLRPGDKIVAINGRHLQGLEAFYECLGRGKPGDAIFLTVERPGVPAALDFRATLQPWPATSRSLGEALASEMVYAFPVWFVVVGFSVLFLRIEDRNAWLLAVLFSSFIAGAPLFPFHFLIPHALLALTLVYKVALYGLFPAIFYYFFAVFPAPSKIDQWMPWLKNVLVMAAGVVVFPLCALAVAKGSPAPVWGLGIWISTHYYPLQLIIIVYFIGFFLLGLVSLAWNGFFAPAIEVRRKIRVIVWGIAIGLTPGMVMSFVAALTSKSVPELLPVWLWGPIVFGSFWLFPLSFAYAVAKHRVLEVPVLLKRSARYFLVQRGFVVVQVLLSTVLTAVLALALSRTFQVSSQLIVLAVLTAAVIFGSVLALSGMRIHQVVTQRIDRAFFREAYDARQILESLVEEARTVRSRDELAVLLGGEIRQALHPTSAAVYLAGDGGRLKVYPESSLATPRELSAGMALLVELDRRKELWEVTDGDGQGETLVGSLALFGPQQPECFVPILMRNGSLTGLLTLGPRLSEEPYSHEDKRLLSSVAAQAGITLENMRLAEEMAERIEAERRVAHDMEIAKQVQARLFPQKRPMLQTLEYSGRCIQARQVGGDYYDFVSLGEGRVGIVLADIAGKGIPGALLMANLQADVRSQCAVAAQDLARFLKSINQSFYERTDESSFATLFFGDYQDTTRRLRFANCGHNPPFLVHPDGSAERLCVTATVLGLFEKWESSICEVQIGVGDVLVIYTDGITEASNSAMEEFGEGRLLEAIRANRSLSVEGILDAIFKAAVEFSHQDQGDDLTLVVARGC